MQYPKLRQCKVMAVAPSTLPEARNYNHTKQIVRYAEVVIDRTTTPVSALDLKQHPRRSLRKREKDTEET